MNSLSLSSCFALKPCCRYRTTVCRSKESKTNVGIAAVSSALSYQKFVDFALDETKRRTLLLPSSLQDKFSYIQAIDGKAQLKFLSFEATKIRLFRSMYIDGDDSMQVLDFGVFPKVEFDLPIFCANFFSSSAMSIIVLDLNPLYDVITNREYKEKYYKNLMHLSVKYAENMYSFCLGEGNSREYFKAWLDLMEQAVEEAAPSQIMRNREAQHRYLTWRAGKDPGHQMLKKLVGETAARDVLRSFLFDGVDELGSKTFLDYFPDYLLEDGTVNEKRSVAGKSFENRPWDCRGEFLDNTLQ